MRRISLWMLSTVAALVLLFSYRTSTGSAIVETAAVAPSTATGEGRTFTGDTAQTREGDVQVVITVAAGKITSVAVPVHPAGSRKHDEISARALPRLVEATLTAQSADIDSVSGATYTSDGYRQSLQSAIDAAGL